MTETIMVFCAHSDDQILGLGGILSKYAEEGKKIITVIFSFGEKSHPHLKPEIIRKIRVEEAKNADKVIGGSGVLFLGLRETKFLYDADKLNIKSKLIKLIEKHKPSIIFTHASDDKDIPSLDHPKVNKIVMSTLDSIDYKGRVYAFDVWNPFNFKNRFQPRQYFDISKTFKKKIQALDCFASQQIALSHLLIGTYIKALIYGFYSGHEYAERFYILK